MCARYSHQRICTGTGGLGNKRTSGDHPNYSIVEIGQNTKESWWLEETFCHLDSSGKPSAHVGVKNSQMNKVIIEKTRLSFKSQEKKRAWHIVDFALLADHRVKVKEGGNLDKYYDLARELKERWKMSVSLTTIEMVTLETIL